MSTWYTRITVTLMAETTRRGTTHASSWDVRDLAPSLSEINSLD
jgi:hypothetical protein